MFIGIAALFLAVGAYIYKEGLRPYEILTRLAGSFAFWGAAGPQRTITDGSDSKESINLEKVKGSGDGTADGGYIAGLPSRRDKVDMVVVEDEEEDPTTPTAPVKIELSIPDVEVEPKGVRSRKGKARRLPDDDSDEDLSVPMFPALNSAQRASKPASVPQAPSLVVPGSMGPPPLPVPKLATGPPSLTLPSFAAPGLMPPPPIPMRKPAGSSAAASARNAQYARPGGASSSSLGVPPSASSLAVPPSASSSLGVPKTSSLQLPPTHSQPPPKPRQKVILTPGHSPLDWANHQRNLPFVPLRRIAPSELATHGARKNETKTYWTVLEGKVYDMTPYLPYHPGGEKELLRVAGKDGTKLFNLTHPWVNWDNMLRGCEVGILVSENEMLKKEVTVDSGVGGEEEDLESMD
ncbi:hypothetical protein EYR41_009864 [Orbilia oligospora]|uniref:Cytochrome b5 heme-binding domain-containing protein n=1 Tax=Orbilia oligospora TaxID=2813651 RepID=A0A8H2DUH5_ORBOL|nr:hypothetical protein TWF132_007625 [Orbilia oligospora]TGJ65929.1 hypothetical protein EYR41_009864 [Orbilia oligospora]